MEERYCISNDNHESYELARWHEWRREWIGKSCSLILGELGEYLETTPC